MGHFMGRLPAEPRPIQGEGGIAYMRMSKDVQKGWRISATSDQGRDIGRWVSDCPRTIVDQALAWLEGFGWRIVDFPDSRVSFLEAMNSAVVSPDAPVDPFQVLALLLSNFEAPAPGPEVRPRIERRPDRLLATRKPRDPEPEPEDEEVDEAGEETDEPPKPTIESDPKRFTVMFLRDAVQALRRGADPDQVREFTLAAFKIRREPTAEAGDAADMARLFVGLRRSLRNGWSVRDVRRALVRSMCVVPPPVEPPALTDEAGVPPALIEAADAPPVRTRTPRLRPILPNEDLPPELDGKIPPENPADRAKMDRSIRRAQEAHEMADRANRAAARRAAQQALQGTIPPPQVITMGGGKPPTAQPFVPVEPPVAPVAPPAPPAPVVPAAPTGDEPTDPPSSPRKPARKPRPPRKSRS